MEGIKEPSPMREARDVSPSPVPPSALSPTSAPMPEHASTDTPTPAQAPKPSRPARSRPLLDKSLGPRGEKGAVGGKVRAAKSIFGVVVGTLKKAELEDKKRNATEAAKKRAIIDSRLQNKIARETATVRRTEENKRDRHGANRREEDLALRESLFKIRQTRGRLLGNFLRTDDDFLKDDDDDDDREDAMEMDEDSDGRGSAHPSNPDDHPDPESVNGADTTLISTQEVNAPSNSREAFRKTRDLETKERQRRAKEKAKIDLLLAPSRGHPPSMYYLPAILLPSQRRFLEKRKNAINEVLEKESKVFMEERRKEVVEIRAIRKKVEDEEEKLRAEKKELESVSGSGVVGDVDMKSERNGNHKEGKGEGEEMDIEDDDESVRQMKDRDGDGKKEQRKKGEEYGENEKSSSRGALSTAMDEDRDDAVEY